ncbi:MAG: serine/threonine protein kinase [Planctomycetes bacterium]|nr:serine/threonine protein kinase [Planctomycetota bacterium]
MDRSNESFEDAFRIIPRRLIGKGGMGEVYEAEMHGVEGFARPVALKLIKEEYSTRPDFIRLFVAEARLAALLNHPNIIQVYHFGRTGIRYYLLMEFVEGMDLEAFIVRHRLLRKPVPPEVAVRIVTGILKALAHANDVILPNGSRTSIVHSDVSPRNVMLSFEGGVKLGDFGIARAAEESAASPGRYMGKPEYLSPERIEDGVSSPAGDIFAVALVLYEMITLHHPFYNEDIERTMENVRYAPVPAPADLVPDIPPRLSTIVLTGLARRLDERYADAFQFLDALQELISRFLAGSPPALSDYMSELLEE